MKQERITKMARIGIYAGTFDPVHAGHLDFALRAREQADLSRIYFLPEVSPRGKSQVTHFAHRSAMLKLATRPHSHCHVLHLPDKQFTVAHTLPRLRLEFPHDHLVIMMGSDTYAGLAEWSLVDQLLTECGFIVAIRNHQEISEILTTAKALPMSPRELHIIESGQPKIASSLIRQAVEEGRHPIGLLYSVEQYVRKNWLYSSLSAS